MIPTPFRQHIAVVLPEWIDDNDHMNMRFYSTVVFDAQTLFSRYIGFSEEYIKRMRAGKVVVESHLNYERELRLGDRIEVASRLLAVSEKRLHFYHEVFNADQGYRAAVAEQLDIYVDLTTRRATVIPESFQTHLQAIVDAHAQLPPPDKIGRSVTMERRYER